jgi:hypothetical protein
LEEGRKRFSEVNQSVGRSQTLLLSFVAANELLVSSSIDRASFGGFEVTNLTTVRDFIPAVLAYLFYSASAVWSLDADLSPKYNEAMRQLYPAILHSEANSLLEPLKNPIAGVQRIGWLKPFYWILIVITFLGVPLYIAYSYYRILSQFDDALFPIVLSIVLAAFFVIYGACLMIDAVLLKPRRGRIQSSFSRRMTSPAE